MPAARLEHPQRPSPSPVSTPFWPLRSRGRASAKASDAARNSAMVVPPTSSAFLPGGRLGNGVTGAGSLSMNAICPSVLSAGSSSASSSFSNSSPMPKPGKNLSVTSSWLLQIHLPTLGADRSVLSSSGPLSHSHASSPTYRSIVCEFRLGRLYVARSTVARYVRCSGGTVIPVQASVMRSQLSSALSSWAREESHTSSSSFSSLTSDGNGAPSSVPASLAAELPAPLSRRNGRSHLAVLSRGGCIGPKTMRRDRVPLHAEPSLLDETGRRLLRAQLLAFLLGKRLAQLLRLPFGTLARTANVLFVLELLGQLPGKLVQGGQQIRRLGDAQLGVKVGFECVRCEATSTTRTWPEWMLEDVAAWEDACCAVECTRERLLEDLALCKVLKAAEYLEDDGYADACARCGDCGTERGRRNALRWVVDQLTHLVSSTPRSCSTYF